MKGAARTLDLFEAYAEAREPMSLTEIAQRIGVPISSCHALLRTLQSRGYIYRLENPKRFYPTKRLSLIARPIAEHDHSLRRITPIVERLMEATGETAIVGKLLEESAVYLDVIEGKHTIRYTAAAGDTKPAHSSAIGKATLSLLEGEELRRAISKLNLTRVTDKTIVDPTDLETDIIESRKRGYFLSRGETVSDVMGVAIARRIEGGAFGVGIAGPILRMEDQLTEYLGFLQHAGREIELLG